MEELILTDEEREIILSHRKMKEFYSKKPEGLYIGQKVRVKKDIWDQFIKEQNFPREKNPSYFDQTYPAPEIAHMPSHTPYHNSVSLTFPPLVWWHEDDIIPID